MLCGRLPSRIFRPPFQHRIRNRLRVPNGNDFAIYSRLDQVRSPAIPCCDHGQAAGDRLFDNEGKTFHKGGEDEEIRRLNPLDILFALILNPGIEKWRPINGQVVVTAQNPFHISPRRFSQTQDGARLLFPDQTKRFQQIGCAFPQRENAGIEQGQGAGFRPFRVLKVCTSPDSGVGHNTAPAACPNLVPIGIPHEGAQREHVINYRLGFKAVLDGKTGRGRVG